MKPSTSNKNRGAANVVKGKIKEVAGKATGKPNLELKGRLQKGVGKVQREVGKSQQARGD